MGVDNLKLLYAENMQFVIVVLNICNINKLNII